MAPTKKRKPCSAPTAWTSPTVSTVPGQRFLHVTLTKDDWIDVMDHDGVWNVAKVLEVTSEHEVKVRYDGWGDEYDEVLSLNCDRIAPFHTYTWAVKCWAKYLNWPWWPSVVTIRAPGTAEGADNLRIEQRLYVDYMDQNDFLKRCRSWTTVKDVVPFNDRFDERRKRTTGKDFENALESVLKSNATTKFPTFVEGTLPMQYQDTVADPVKKIKRSMGNDMWVRNFTNNRQRYNEIHGYKDFSGHDVDGDDKGGMINTKYRVKQKPVESLQSPKESPPRQTARRRLIRADERKSFRTRSTDLLSDTHQLHPNILLVRDQITVDDGDDKPKKSAKKVRRSPVKEPSVVETRPVVQILQLEPKYKCTIARHWKLPTKELAAKAGKNRSGMSTKDMNTSKRLWLKSLNDAPSSADDKAEGKELKLLANHVGDLDSLDCDDDDLWMATEEASVEKPRISIATIPDITEPITSSLRVTPSSPCEANSIETEQLNTIDEWDAAQSPEILDDIREPILAKRRPKLSTSKHTKNVTKTSTKILANSQYLAHDDSTATRSVSRKTRSMSKVKAANHPTQAKPKSFVHNQILAAQQLLDLDEERRASPLASDIMRESTRPNSPLATVKQILDVQQEAYPPCNNPAFSVTKAKLDGSDLLVPLYANMKVGPGAKEIKSGPRERDTISLKIAFDHDGLGVSTKHDNIETSTAATLARRRSSMTTDDQVLYSDVDAFTHTDINGTDDGEVVPTLPRRFCAMRTQARAKSSLAAQRKLKTYAARSAPSIVVTGSSKFDHSGPSCRWESNVGQWSIHANDEKKAGAIGATHSMIRVASSPLDLRLDHPPVVFSSSDGFSMDKWIKKRLYANFFK